MMDKISRFIKKYPEKYLARLFGRFFWPPTSVAVLVHGNNDDILALRLDGRYRLPGGIIDIHEDLKEAAQREVLEETGYNVDVGEILDIDSNSGGGPEIFFEAEVVEGELKSSWEGEPEFIDKDEISDKVWQLEHSHIREYLFPEE